MLAQAGIQWAALLTADSSLNAGYSQFSTAVMGRLAAGNCGDPTIPTSASRTNFIRVCLKKDVGWKVALGADGGAAGER